MTTLRLVESGRHALKLFAILLGITVIGGVGLALGLALAGPQVSPLLDDGSVEYTELAGGAVLAFLGFAVLSVGYIAVTYKLIADAVTAGYENADSPVGGSSQQSAPVGSPPAADGRHSPEPPDRAERESIQTRTGPSPGEQAAKRYGPGSTVSDGHSGDETPADSDTGTPTQPAEPDTSSAGETGDGDSGPGIVDRETDLGSPSTDPAVDGRETAIESPDADDRVGSAPGLAPDDREGSFAAGSQEPAESDDGPADGFETEPAGSSSGDFDFGDDDGAPTAGAPDSAGADEGESDEEDPGGPRHEPSAEEIVFGGGEDGGDDDDTDEAPGADADGDERPTDEPTGAREGSDPETAGDGSTSDPLAERTDEE